MDRSVCSFESTHRCNDERSLVRSQELHGPNEETSHLINHCEWLRDVDTTNFEWEFNFVCDPTYRCLRDRRRVKIHGLCLQQVTTGDRLVHLVVRRPPRGRKIPGSNPACAGIYLGSSHTSDLKTGILVATLPGAWRCMASAGTGQYTVTG